MKKIFNDNDAYFRWFNKNLGKINILEVDVKDVIIVFYKKEANLC